MSPKRGPDFAVLDAAQFVVLLPETGFEGFQRRQEAENGRVSGVRPPLASTTAGNPLATRPAPMVPAASTASPLRKKERRLLAYFASCTVCAMIGRRSWPSPSRSTRV